MKILFLDVDGVFNSYRSNFGLGPLPFRPVEEQRHRFDWCAIGMVRRLTVDDPAVQIVLSSTWRMGQPENGKEQFQLCGDFFELPIIGATDCIGSNRGEQIKRWLDAHEEVEHYVILDDDADMLEEQAPHFVQTSFQEGMLYRHFKACQRILDGKLGGLYRRERFWERQDEHYKEGEWDADDDKFYRVGDI